MIEVLADGTGALTIRSGDPKDVIPPDADGFVRLSPAAVGELVRMAARQPDALPQDDARALLRGTA